MPEYFIIEKEAFCVCLQSSFFVVVGERNQLSSARIQSAVTITLSCPVLLAQQVLWYMTVGTSVLTMQSKGFGSRL